MSTVEKSKQDSIAADVRGGLDLFIGAIKKHAFYPEGNPILEQAVESFLDWLEAFLDRNGDLRIDVGKNQFVYQGEVVQQEKPGERAVIFPLFRDGVQCFEFREGVSHEEIRSFIRILNRYREYRDDAENDLVTALWEADFQSIGHRAVDKFWEGETQIDIATFKVFGGTAQAPKGYDDLGYAVDDAPEDGPEGTGKKEEIRDPAARTFMTELKSAQTAAGHGAFGDNEAEGIGNFWKLTPAEEAALGNLISTEMLRNTTKDCLDVLLVLVGEALDAPDRALVRNFVAEEIRHLLSQGEFAYARNFVERLDAIRNGERSEASRFADELAGLIAGPEVLGGLGQAWPRFRSLPEIALAELRRLLLLLPPTAINALAPMAAGAADPRARALVMHAVAYHAGRSRFDTTGAVGSMPPGLICELMESYAGMGQSPPATLLAGLARHREAAVREAAARWLVADNPDNLKAVIHLLDDPDPGVVRSVLALLGKGRNPLAERLLLDRLAAGFGKGAVRDEKHILECYRALGRCATAASVEILRGVLMRRSWRAFLGIERDPHRAGAAAALSLMPEDSGADEILRSAGGSRFRSIRRALEHAERNTRRRVRDSNG